MLISLDTSVQLLACSDADTVQSTLTYAISPSNSHFKISSSTTGQVDTTATPLDYESTTKHTLTITVTDTGGLSTTATLIVTVSKVKSVFSSE